MKRYVLLAVFALAAIGAGVVANVATVQGPLTAVCTTENGVPERLHVESLGTANRPVAATGNGFSPGIVCFPSRPVIPGEPAISLAPDGTTFAPFHAYEPADIYAAYGVDRLHAEGITGKGQTIVIIDAWGSPTALEDLQAFSSAFGLTAPALKSGKGLGEGV